MKNKDKAIKWIIKHSKKQLFKIILLSFFSGFIALSFIILALMSRKIIDIATGNAYGNIYFWGAGIIAIAFVQAVLNIIISNITVRAKGNIEIEIKKNLFSLILQKQWQEFSKFHSGEIINRFTSDVEIVVTNVVTIIPLAVSLFTKLAAGITVLIYIDYKFTFAVAFVGLIVIFFNRLFSPIFKKLHKLCQSTDGQTRSFLQECIENLIVIKSFSNYSNMLERLNILQKNNFKAKIKRNAVSNIANTGAYVLFTLSYYCALIWGAFQIIYGNITFGTLTAFLQIIEQIKAPMKNMSGIIPQYYLMIASAERIIEIENLPDEEFKTIPLDIKDIYNSMVEIKVNNINFNYDNNVVFKNASVSFEKGKITAISGSSGIGKSTLMKLLLGIWKTDNGSISIKTKSGDINIDVNTRKLFAYVPQGNMLLSGTIKENISFCCPDANDNEIEYAAKIADIFDFIDKLPQKMNTVIGERGIGLSEGQIQRIAIARAILSHAPILLMDEATSALDLQTENNILKNIKTLKNKTCIFISHKNTTLLSCDKIIRIENRRIKYIEKGEIFNYEN